MLLIPTVLPAVENMNDFKNRLVENVNDYHESDNCEDKDYWDINCNNNTDW